MPSHPVRVGDKDSEDDEKKSGVPWTGIIMRWSKMLSKFIRNFGRIDQICTINTKLERI
jgi:hypothetical protein